jgi:hypothetical protein
MCNQICPETKGLNAIIAVAKANPNLVVVAPELQAGWLVLACVQFRRRGSSCTHLRSRSRG